MNSKLIQQYGEDILCYRLRTARQKKRMQYKDFEKQLLKINREERKLLEKRQETLNGSHWCLLFKEVGNGFCPQGRCCQKQAS